MLALYPPSTPGIINEYANDTGILTFASLTCIVLGYLNPSTKSQAYEGVIIHVLVICIPEMGGHQKKTTHYCMLFVTSYQSYMHSVAYEIPLNCFNYKKDSI